MRVGYTVGALLITASFLSACRKVPEAKVPASPQASRVVISTEEALPQVDVLPTFVNAAPALGISFSFFNDEVEGRFFLPEVMGGGAAWLDFDLDGYFDLFLVNGGNLDSSLRASRQPNNSFYRFDGTSFRDIAEPSFTASGGTFGQGCCVGDFNSDGFPDLYVCQYGPNRLLQNNGDGTFEDVTNTAAVGDTNWGTSSVFIDLNDDAYLDIYVVNYLDATLANTKACEYDGKPGYCGPGSHEAVPDIAYLSNGDGTFTNGAELLGLTAANGKGLAVSVVDFDNDAKPEIYIANDMAENFLYRRTGSSSDLRYENIARASGCSVEDDGSLVASMGTSCADFDGDGLVDIFVTNFFAKGNVLFHNLGDLLFVDDKRRSRIAATSFQNLGFGTVPLDYDLDGARDLFIANGHVLGPQHSPNEMHPQLLHNSGTGRFDDVSKLAGEYFADLWLGRGAASCDYDNDGDPDLVVTHLHRPVALLRNDTVSGNHFIGFELRAAHRLEPWGGRVEVTAGTRKFVVPAAGGGSYLCSSDPRINVGLGKWDRPVQVNVYWPSGDISSFESVSTGRYWKVVEGGELQASLAPAQLIGVISPQ